MDFQPKGQFNPKIKFSKKIVSLIVVLNVLFAAAVLYIFFRNSTEPTTLIISWFAFTTGELFLVAQIKNKEEKKEQEKDKETTKTKKPDNQVIVRNQNTLREGE